MAERLMAVMDGAELVKYDPDGYALVWFGGDSTGVSVYDEDGEQIGFWQIAVGASGKLTRDEVLASMIEHMSSGDPYTA